MPGPFPGMDPYLEMPVIWSGIHSGLMTEIRNALNAVLPPGYLADMGERTMLLKPDDSIFPDVVTFAKPPRLFCRHIGL